MATNLKIEGNTLFQAGRYPEALAKYSAAIKLDPTKATFYGNRCAAHSKMGNHEIALEDAEKATTLDPAWSKGFIRKSQVLTALGRGRDALHTLEVAAGSFVGDVPFEAALKNAQKAAEEEKDFKGGVVDFGVNKSIGDAAVRSKDYAKAEASYSNTLGVMEQMLAKLPPDQAEKMRKQLDSIKGKMSAELGAAAKATK